MLLYLFQITFDYKDKLNIYELFLTPLGAFVAVSVLTKRKSIYSA